jgi:hypothetical protein
MSLCRSIAALVLLAAPTESIAGTTCEPTPQGDLCVSQVDFMQFAEQAYMSQLQSQWCWAASISMVFAFHDHLVSQARIVSDVYGAPENIPAQTGIVIANELNRCWADDYGATFQSQLTGAYDFDAGVNALTNAMIVGELDQDRPLVIGNRTHAMVLTAVQYYPTPGQPNIVAGGVFDPWPGIGARGLTTAELYPMHVGGDLRFLATVSVTDAQCVPPPPGPSPGFDDGGCGGAQVTPRASLTTSGFVVLAVLLVLRRRPRR